MALVTLEEAKTYLRVDSSEEDAVVGILLTSAGKLCADVARLTDEQWAAVDADETEDTASYTEEELSRIREVMKVAVLYARTDQVGFLSTQRVDGKLILPEAVQVLQMKGSASSGS